MTGRSRFTAVLVNGLIPAMPQCIFLRPAHPSLLSSCFVFSNLLVFLLLLFDDSEEARDPVNRKVIHPIGELVCSSDISKIATLSFGRNCRNNVDRIVSLSSCDYRGSARRMTDHGRLPIVLVGKRNLSTNNDAVTSLSGYSSELESV